MTRQELHVLRISNWEDWLYYIMALRMDWRTAWFALHTTFLLAFHSISSRVLDFGLGLQHVSQRCQVVDTL